MTTATADPNVLPINGSDNGSTYNTSTQTITPGQMSGQNPITTVPTPTDPNNYPAIVTGNAAATAAQQASDTAAANDAALNSANNDTTNPNSIAGQYLATMGLLDNKAADTQAAQDAAGVTSINSQMNDINAQIQNVSLYADARNNTMEGAASKGFGTSGMIGAEESAVNRNAAIQSSILSARYNVLKGNYDTAMTQAQKAIDLKYTPIENKLKTLQQQYDFNKDALTAADKKASEALQASITAKANVVAEQKQQEQNNVSSANTYIKLAGDARQMDIASEIQKLDPASSTFKADLAALVTQIKPKADTSGEPNSYKEWSLAGGKTGTGQTYAEYIKSTAPKTPEETAFNSDLQKQLDSLSGISGTGGDWASSYNAMVNRYGSDYPELTTNIKNLTPAQQQQYSTLLSKKVAGDNTLLDILMNKSKYYKEAK